MQLIQLQSRLPRFRLVAELSVCHLSSRQQPNVTPPDPTSLRPVQDSPDQTHRRRVVSDGLANRAEEHQLILLEDCVSSYLGKRELSLTLVA